MQMQTSYFGNPALNGVAPSRLVSIALYPPRGWRGRTYPQLTPPGWLLGAWKADVIAWEAYRSLYVWFVLAERRLSPAQVLADLGPDAILLCWEKDPGWCHRRLVGAWLEAATVECSELRAEERDGHNTSGDSGLAG